MKRTITAAVAGVVAGAALTLPFSAQAHSAWRTWHGFQTGEVIVCPKTKGVPAYDWDRKRNQVVGPYVVVHCNGRTWGRP